MFVIFKAIRYSRLSRFNTARGSGTFLVRIGPAKVKACKSVLFTEGTPEVKNKEHMINETDNKLPFKSKSKSGLMKLTHFKMLNKYR